MDASKSRRRLPPVCQHISSFFGWDDHPPTYPLVLSSGQGRVCVSAREELLVYARGRASFCLPVVVAILNISLSF